MIKKVTHKDDKRLVELSLTKKGIDFIEKIKPEIFQFEKHVLKHISQKDYEYFYQLIEKIDKGLNESNSANQLNKID